jgi:hypothetical protein
MEEYTCKGDHPTAPEIYSALLKQKSMEKTQPGFDQWCIVELFGHQRIAGRCTEKNLFGTNFLQVDVPETKSQPAFSKLFGGAAVYAINPVDESTARLAVEKLEIAPVTVWQGESFIKKFNENKVALPEPEEEFTEEDF